MKRIILKISGEALSGGSQMGISAENVKRQRNQSRSRNRLSTGVIIGAGNIWRDGMRLTTEWKSECRLYGHARDHS